MWPWNSATRKFGDDEVMMLSSNIWRWRPNELRCHAAAEGTCAPAQPLRGSAALGLWQERKRGTSSGHGLQPPRSTLAASHPVHFLPHSAHDHFICSGRTSRNCCLWRFSFTTLKHPTVVWVMRCQSGTCSSGLATGLALDRIALESALWLSLEVQRVYFLAKQILTQHFDILFFRSSVRKRHQTNPR